MASKGESESALLKRWKRMVKSNPELDERVHENASRLLSGIQRHVKERQWCLVESVVMDAAEVSLTTEKPAYVV